jgi:hypothetical protein
MSAKASDGKEFLNHGSRKSRKTWTFKKRFKENAFLFIQHLKAQSFSEASKVQENPDF